MKKYFSKADIEHMERLFRVNLINSLVGFKSVNLIGTKSKSGLSNLAIFNTIFHLGSNPPILGVMFRPTAVPRHTLTNVLETGYYTINHVNSEILSEAHKTSAKYEIDESEFDFVNLKEDYLNSFYAPFVKESKIKIAMKFVEKHDIKINNTIILVGEIQEIHFDGNILHDDGFLDIEKAGTIAGSGCDAYYSTKKIVRYAYYKPKKELLEIKSFLN